MSSFRLAKGFNSTVRPWTRWRKSKRRRPFLTRFLKVLQSRADDAEAGLHGVVRTEGMEGLLLDGLEKLILHLETHRADFIEEQSPPSARRSLPLRPSPAPVKAPLR